MKTLEEFKSYYEEVMVPELAGLEARRRRTVWGVAVMSLASVCLLGVSLATMIGGISAVGDTALFYILGISPFILCFLLWFVAYPLLTRAYLRDFKEDIMGKIAPFIDEGLTYSPDRFVKESTYMDSGIFSSEPDRYGGGNLFFGTIGETKVEFSEIQSEYKTETKGSQGVNQVEWHTIFRGIFFSADFNKHFNGRTFVLPDTAERLFGAMIGGFLQGHTRGRPPLVRLEDPEFERYFVVYADDQVESRYILSLSLMERIVAFRRRTGRKVYLSFADDNIMVAIPCERELFKPRLYRTVLDFGLVEGYFENILHAAEIVEDLNLNTRIWGRE
jgi:hypothetical protein